MFCVFVGLLGSTTPISASKVTNWSHKTKDILRDPVVKFGQGSGLSRGTVYSEGLFVTPANKTQTAAPITLNHQIEVRSDTTAGSMRREELPSFEFFLPGDSGALILAAGQDNCLGCLGMAVGYTSYGSCIATPIESILDSLGVRQSFLGFSETHFLSSNDFLV